MNDERLLDLIDQLVLGDLSADDHDRLQQTLKQDAVAREIFRERMDLEAGLRTCASEEHPSSSESATPEHSRAAGKNYFLLQRKILAFCIAASLFLIVCIPLSSFLGRSNQQEVVENNGPDPVLGQPQAKFFGFIRQQDDCEWSISPPSHSGRPSGRLTACKLALSKGIAELSFDSGTNVTLDAPCEIEITSADTARLLAGNVFVDVTELSNGFTLSTPESQIIDEGTEYAVSVGDEATEVHVFDGRVVWIAESGGVDSQSSFEERIEAGEARGYLRSNPSKSKIVPFGKRQFVRHLEQQVKATAGDSLLAYDGFENLVGRLRRGRSGFGWAGGWQAGGQARGPLADVVDSPDHIVFGLDRSDRRQVSLAGGCDIRRTFENPIELAAGKSVFLSVLLSRQGAQNIQESQSLQISLEPDLPGRGRRLHQIVSFGTTTEGFPFINSGNKITQTASRIVSGQTYLYVLRVAISEDGTLPSLRVYQTYEKVDASEPTAWTVSGELGSAEYPLASIRIITGENAAWQVDELKVGSTWQAVTVATSD
ncbi:MAG: FecR family protein [Planctomycetota bacterium]